LIYAHWKQDSGIPLVINEEGKLEVEGKGKIIDWLVKMKRISEKNFLDQAIAHHDTDKSVIEETANLLAAFYKNASPVQFVPEQYRQKLKNEIIFIHLELLQPVFHFPGIIIEKINSNLVSFLSSHASLFDKRITNGKIIEAHGDLRPEHICLPPQPAIIDALEFNKELRIMDIAEELSFLDMECEMMGDTATGRIFFDYYNKLSGDDVPEMLVFFYKAKKAFLRTYLVARHITEDGYKKEPKWMNKANAYLQLSNKYNSLLPA
jgi:aminoglycoside phosphotransferase family enzyme